MVMTESQALKAAQPMLHEIARKYVGQGIDLQDLLQEAQMAFVIEFRKDPCEGKPLTSLYVSVSSRVRSATGFERSFEWIHTKRVASKGQPSEMSMDSVNAEGLTLHDSIGTPAMQEDAADHSMRIRGIQKNLEELSEVERDIIDLRLSGVTLQDTAKQVGCSDSTAHRIETKALAILADKMRDVA